MKIKGTTALVTGAARRVGREIALALAREGADIVAHYHSSRAEAQSLSREIAKLGRKCTVIAADLGEADGAANLVKSLTRKKLKVDILVNSASVFFDTPFDKLPAATFDHILQVNFRSPFLLTRELGLKMAAAGRGKIINITDSANGRPYKNHSPYLISKGALASATEVLALELAPKVQVNAIAPGTVALPENWNESQGNQIARRTPLQRLGSPEDIAKAVVFLVRDGDFMTGSTITVDGGAALK